MNLAVRDIRHHLGRFILTCLGLALLLGVVISMIGIYRGLVADALVLVRAPRPICGWSRAAPAAPLPNRRA